MCVRACILGTNKDEVDEERLAPLGHGRRRHRRGRVVARQVHACARAVVKHGRVAVGTAPHTGLGHLSKGPRWRKGGEGAVQLHRHHHTHVKKRAQDWGWVTGMEGREGDKQRPKPRPAPRATTTTYAPSVSQKAHVDIMVSMGILSLAIVQENDEKKKPTQRRKKQKSGQSHKQRNKKKKKVRKDEGKENDFHFLPAIICTTSASSTWQPAASHTLTHSCAFHPPPMPVMHSGQP